MENENFNNNNNNNQDNISQINDNNSSAQLKRFKIMTNIIRGAMHQTRYMKSLEKITIDAQVSYNRLFIAMGCITISLFLYFQLAFDGGKTGYVILPATLTLIAVLILLVNFLISSRTKSMLFSALRLAYHPFLERARRKTKRLGDLKTLGIKDFNKGVIHYTNGDFGLIYKIDGTLSLSALPSTANLVADAKSSYLVGRPASTQELMLVSVIENDTINQQLNLARYVQQANSGSMGDLWIKAMAIKTQEIIETRLNGEYTVIEYLILRDSSIDSLKKAAQNLDRSVSLGLYAKADRLMNRKDVVEALAPIAMLSKKGKSKYGK